MCAEKSLEKDQQEELSTLLAKAGLSNLFEPFIREKVKIEKSFL